MTSTIVQDVGLVSTGAFLVRNESRLPMQNEKDKFQTYLQKSAKQWKNQEKLLSGKERNAQDARGNVKLSKKNTDSASQLEDEKEDVAKENMQLTLLEIVGTLQEEVKTVYGLSEEQLQEMMQGLELQPMDLLQEQKLSSLLLEAAGAEDSLSLLTSEGMYQQFQKLMNIRETLLAGLPQGAEEGQSKFVLMSDSLETLSEDELQQAIVADGTGDAELDFGERENEITHFSQSQKQVDGNTEENGRILIDNATFQHNQESSSTQQMEVVSEEGSVWDADTQNIMRQIMDYMKIQVTPDMSDIRMQLHPASLGTLQIQLASKDGIVTAQFFTQNETVKAALESQILKLQESFEQQGVRVEAIEVSVQTNQFDRNLDQEQKQQQGNNTRKSSVRRFRNTEDLNSLQEAKEEEMLIDSAMSTATTVDVIA